ncbi:MAG: hypothetical protein JWO38_473 [Gemmataceae bacterium]|nr:hypothetical protein [Gemmataceae bacterium]
MPVVVRSATAATLAAVALVVAGCSDPYGSRMEVAGTVKLKGHPIKDGALVEFAPLENQDTGVNAVITGGAFSIPRQNGLKPGNYLVRVTAGDGKTPVNPVDVDSPPGPGGGANIISKDIVPPDWNRNSKQQVTVTKEGPNKFDFNIP